MRRAQVPARTPIFKLSDECILPQVPGNIRRSSNENWGRQGGDSKKPAAKVQTAPPTSSADKVFAHVQKMPHSGPEIRQEGGQRPCAHFLEKGPNLGQPSRHPAKPQ